MGEKKQNTPESLKYGPLDVSVFVCAPSENTTEEKSSSDFSLRLKECTLITCGVLSTMCLRHIHYIREYAAGGKRLRSTDTTFICHLIVAQSGSAAILAPKLCNEDTGGTIV